MLGREESESVLESVSESESPKSGRKKSSGLSEPGNRGSWRGISTLICVGGARGGVEVGLGIGGHRREVVVVVVSPAVIIMSCLG